MYNKENEVLLAYSFEVVAIKEREEHVRVSYKSFVLGRGKITVNYKPFNKHHYFLNINLSIFSIISRLYKS
jgi:hypothetical protein